jgi:hypothetical protein
LTSLRPFTRTISAIAKSAGLLNSKGSRPAPEIILDNADDGDMSDSATQQKRNNKVEPEVLRALAQVLSRDRDRSPVRGGNDDNGNHNPSSTADPSAVKKAIEKHMKEFQGYRQQDAHEFLCSCLDRLDQEIEALPEPSSKVCMCLIHVNLAYGVCDQYCISY